MKTTLIFWTSLFRGYFGSDDGHKLNLNCSNYPYNHLCDIISVDDIALALKMVPNKLSRSPDYIPAYFKKKNSLFIVHAIGTLFTLQMFHWRYCPLSMEICYCDSNLWKRFSRQSWKLSSHLRHLCIISGSWTNHIWYTFATHLHT